MDNKIGATFVAQVHKVESRKDGSGRITLEFGAESIDDVQWAQALAVKRDVSFEIAMVPLNPLIITTDHEETIPTPECP